MGPDVATEFSMCKKSSEVRLAHIEENMHSHPPGIRSST